MNREQSSHKATPGSSREEGPSPEQPRSNQEQVSRCYTLDAMRRDGRRRSGPQLVLGGPGSTPEVRAADVDAVLGACPHGKPMSPGHCRPPEGKGQFLPAKPPTHLPHGAASGRGGWSRSPQAQNDTQAETSARPLQRLQLKTVTRKAARQWQPKVVPPLQEAGTHRPPRGRLRPKQKDVPTACTPTVTAAGNTTPHPGNHQITRHQRQV